MTQLPKLREAKDWINVSHIVDGASGEAVTFGDVREAVQSGTLSKLWVPWRSWNEGVRSYLEALPPDVQARASNLDVSPFQPRSAILVAGVPVYDVTDRIDIPHSAFRDAVRDFVTGDVHDYVYAQTSAEFVHVLGGYLEGEMEWVSARDLLWKHARPHRLEGARLVDAFAGSYRYDPCYTMLYRVPAACGDACPKKYREPGTLFYEAVSAIIASLRGGAHAWQF